MSVCHREPAVQSSGDEDVASCSSLRARAGVECLPPRKNPPGHVAKTELAVIYLARKIRRFRFDANAGEQSSTSSSGLYISAFPTPERFADCDGAAQADLVDFMSAKVARTDMMPHHELLITLRSSTPFPRPVPIACRYDVNPRRLPKASHSNQPG
jgi:hypothetical protein